MAHIHPTPRWREVKPKTRAERYRLAREKPECFLYPEGTEASPGVPSYPICTREGQISCQGLLAAYRRLSVYGKHYGDPNRVRRAMRRILTTARRFADASDPSNVCNFVFQAQQHQKLGGNIMARLKPGQCGITRRGVKYCYIPGRGVRFVGRNALFGEEDLGGRIRTCVRYKQTPAGRRCAKYASLADVGEIAEFDDALFEEDLGGRIRTCVRYKRVWSPRLGKYVRRCAEYV